MERKTREEIIRVMAIRVMAIPVIVIRHGDM